jgi:hypothetical protein
MARTSMALDAWTTSMIRHGKKAMFIGFMVTALIVAGFALYDKRLKCVGARQITLQARVDPDRSASDLEAITLADAYVYAAKNTGGGLTIEKEVGAPWVIEALRHDLENIDFSILVKNNAVDGLLLAGWSGRFGTGNVTYMPVVEGCVYPFSNDMKHSVKMSELMGVVEIWHRRLLK